MGSRGPSADCERARGQLAGPREPAHAKVLPAEVNNHKVSEKEHPAFQGDDVLPFAPKGRQSNRRSTHGLEANTTPQSSRDLRSLGTTAPVTRPKRFV